MLLKKLSEPASNFDEFFQKKTFQNTHFEIRQKLERTAATVN